MYVFSYKVKCEYADDNNKIQRYTSTGLGFADSFKDAAEILEKQYGKEITEILSICLLEDSFVIPLPEEDVEDYKSKDCPDLDYQKPC